MSIEGTVESFTPSRIVIGGLFRAGDALEMRAGRDATVAIDDGSRLDVLEWCRHCEELADELSDALKRVTTLETENRDLRRELDDARREITRLTDRLDDGSDPIGRRPSPEDTSRSSRKRRLAVQDRP